MDAALRIWIPKTGGSSVKEEIKADGVFRGHVGDSMLQPTIHDKAVLFSVGHLTPKMIVDRGLFTPDQLKNIWSFAVVRNPWSKFVSLWTSMGAEAASGFVGGFTEFVERIFMDRGITNSKEKLPLSTTTDEFLLLDGEVIVNEILKTETLDKDWPRVAKRLGFKRTTIGRANAHKYKPYPEYYAPYAVDLIAEKEAWAIKKFGYKFGEDI